VRRFRHLLDENHPRREILGTVNLHLQATGGGSRWAPIVDTTLIHAPSSIKNREQSRDPEMHQTKEGKELVLWDGRRTRDWTSRRHATRKPTSPVTQNLQLPLIQKSGAGQL